MNINPKEEKDSKHKPIKYGFKLGDVVDFDAILKKIKEQENKSNE